jgi:hypothetical protein
MTTHTKLLILFEEAISTMIKKSHNHTAQKLIGNQWVTPDP